MTHTYTHTHTHTLSDGPEGPFKGPVWIYMLENFGAPDIQETDRFPVHPVTGKNKIWLHVSNLTFASCCFPLLKASCQYKMVCLGLGEPCPSLPECQTKVPFFYSGQHSDPLYTCEWLQEIRNTCLPPGWPFQERLTGLMAFVLYFFTSSPSMFYKRNTSSAW